MAYQGYYGTSHSDRYSCHNEQSTIHKMKETYWTTKQVVMRKLGKKEDEHIIASDCQLDSKLEVFKAIQKSCMALLRVIEKYQDRLCALSQEENSMGRLLKTHGQHDKTRAGKMMGAVGKAQSFSSQQRLSLRVPLVRLYQEVETFRYRAISDTLMTINRMERARTEYRGALLWMKDVSEELDPDTYKQLEKFRKVQAQVKKTKAHFDKLKLDTMQKIDLLAASRCNMFSHVLANYQSTLLHFWEKTSRTMNAVAESFKGYQYYEFNILKELKEPSKKLAEEMGTEADQEGSEFSEVTDDTSSRKDGSSTSIVTDIVSDILSEVTEGSHHSDGESTASAVDGVGDEREPCSATPDSLAAKDSLCLISFDEDGAGRSGPEAERDDHLLDALGIDTPVAPPSGATAARRVAPDVAAAFIDFGDEADRDVEEIKRKQDEEFDFSGKILASREGRKMKTDTGGDLLSEEPDETDKDDLALLNEILNAPSSGGDDFSQQWQAVFGSTTPVAPPPVASGTGVLGEQGAQFLPSHLLASMTLQQDSMPAPHAPMVSGLTPMATPSVAATQSKADTKPVSKKDKKGDMSAWFSLFADLDPLANPDAIGRKSDQPTDAL